MISILALVASISAIPPVYHGNWTTDPASCAGEDTSGARIGPGDITFYEAQGSVVCVSEGLTGTSARISFKGEGRSWQETVRMKVLSEGRLELKALGRVQVFGRCS